MFLSLVTRKLFLVSFVSPKKNQNVRRQPFIVEKKKGLLEPEPEQQASAFSFYDELHSDEDTGGEASVQQNCWDEEEKAHRLLGAFADVREVCRLLFMFL